jgi:phosphatidyl-myo-inositol dimannoside synthase
LLQSKTILALFPELLGVGGVQEAGRLTATALSEIAGLRGWTTDLLSLNDPQGRHSLEVGEPALSLLGFGRGKVQFVLAGIQVARSMRRGAACSILAAHPNLALPARWMQWSCPHLKMVVMSHGIELWKPLPTLRRRALLGADILLAPSTDTASKLVSVQGATPGKVRKLAWPISPAFLSMAAAPERLPLPVAFPQGRVILTVGRWVGSERYKGADELIRAIAQLRPQIPTLHLVAVGGGDDLPRLRSLAAEVKVADGVHFLENLSREEIAACYSSADLFALPSTGEGFGMVFVEAMAFAKPVVAARSGGAIDIIEEGNNGLLVPPNDVDRLASVLGRLLKDDSLRRHLGQGGAETVRQKYQFGTFRDELERILTE